MPKPTKQDHALSAFLGGKLSPTQLRRLTTTEGLGLPEGTSWVAYGPVLASLTGRGKDLDVAAVRLAAEHGWATDRLRHVMAQPFTEDRMAQVLGTLRAFTWPGALAYAQKEIEEEPSGIYQATGETAQEVAKTAMATMELDMDDALDGEHDINFTDSAGISRELARLSGPLNPGHTVLEDLTPLMYRVVDALNIGTEQFASANGRDLVAKVQIAALLWETAMPPALPIGEEDRWRAIALTVRATGPLVGLVREVTSRIADACHS